MLGPIDRATADLSKSERKLLVGLGESEGLRELGHTALQALLNVRS